MLEVEVKAVSAECETVSRQRSRSCIIMCRVTLARHAGLHSVVAGSYDQCWDQHCVPQCPVYWHLSLPAQVCLAQYKFLLNMKLCYCVLCQHSQLSVVFVKECLIFLLYQLFLLKTRLVNHPPCISNNNNVKLFYYILSLSDDCWGWSSSYGKILSYNTWYLPLLMWWRALDCSFSSSSFSSLVISTLAFCTDSSWVLSIAR